VGLAARGLNFSYERIVLLAVASSKANDEAPAANRRAMAAPM